MNAEPWVTAIDVARHLGVVKDTVYRWRERKGLPAHKIGRLWKFQLSEAPLSRCLERNHRSLLISLESGTRWSGKQ